MLFAHAFDGPRLIRQVRYFRKSPMRTCGVSLGVVAVATLVRLGLHPQLSTWSPFTTYSLAVICMALAGGFWPGMATLALSLIAGSILFLPPAFTLTLAEGAAWPMVMFALTSSINVVLISGMMASILAHDAHQQLLFRELQHRSRNLFTVIQAVVSRTIAESPTMAEAKSAAETRIAALARTHAMVADSGWIGARLDQIVIEELTGFARQIDCVGCGLLLTTPAAQNFALIIHELTTNAVKYGALSSPQGRITIRGEIDAGEPALFRFRWEETGGAEVTKPSRKGFGNSILNGLAKRFAQGVEVSYRSKGLIYELRIALGAIQARLATDTAPQAVTGHGVYLNKGRTQLQSATAPVVT